ncbi:uncharacterized protein LOC105446757 [Strongylocentrotus purpuratus]|uniref:Uncharacterized protein n=1 Tax=Strongylocentrotus purpuratus TaxID=7668 RepID=A0A7M7NLE8_STRPU|nr:uncharacterized protein LOC105446757 [Strongylocentrotus purpuratus]
MTAKCRPSVPEDRAILPRMPSEDHQKNIQMGATLAGITTKRTEDEKKGPLLNNDFDPVKNLLKMLSKEKGDRTLHQGAEGGQEGKQFQPEFAPLLGMMGVPALSRNSDRINAKDIMLNAVLKNKSAVKMLPMLMSLLRKPS